MTVWVLTLWFPFASQLELSTPDIPRGGQARNVFVVGVFSTRELCEGSEVYRDPPTEFKGGRASCVEARVNVSEPSR
jgi:hypothetical protein